MDELILLSSDPLPIIRVILAEELITIKPYFDISPEQALILTELLTSLMNDPVASVSEAAEHAEFEILANRKKNKEIDCVKADKSKLDFQKNLAIREKKE